MSISASEIKFMKATVMSDAASNGGRMSNTEIASGVKNNVWPDVPASERTAGSTKYRKIFIKIANADNLKLIDTKVFIQTPTPGGDRVVFFAGTQTNVQSDVSGATQVLFGCGLLNAHASLGATTVTVNTEDPSDAIFRPGQLVRVFNKATVDALTGVEEFIRVGSGPSDVVWNGNLATLTFASGATLANSYLASDTKVASVFEYGDVASTTDSWSLASPTGTCGGWNGTGSPTSTLTDLKMIDSIAGIEQTWAITFSNATTFACVGDTVGSVGGGTTLADFAPNNATYSRPYFTLPASLWGGTWAASQAVTFKTHPATIPIWEKRVIPPGTTSLSGNKMVIGVSGESE